MTRDTYRCPDQLYPYPPRGHVARTSIRVPQGEHTTFSNIISGQCSILSSIVRIIDCNEQALLSHPWQSATTHVPPPVERNDRGDDKSPPTISDSRLQGDDDPATTLRTSWQTKKSSHH